MNDRLGCLAYDLVPGDEFSFDEGFSWVVVETIADGPEDQVDINYRYDSGKTGLLRCENYQHFLLNKNYGKEII